MGIHLLQQTDFGAIGSAAAPNWSVLTPFAPPLRLPVDDHFTPAPLRAGERRRHLMATGTPQVDATLLEKVGDSLTSLSERFVGFLTRVLGSSNENFVKKLGYIRSR